MRDRLLKKAVRDRFVVTLKSGQAFDGLLDEWDHSHYLFVDAHALTDEGARQPVSVHGELWVDRGNVAYLQKLPRAVS
ncbi:MAG TPA: hypothetical protein VFH54_03185 [Mycobacteriales bacterium]|nr:hypothetical protein [Mycobacteriales bacterium]